MTRAPQPAPANPQAPAKKKSNPARTIVGLVLLLGIGVALAFALVRAWSISEYNRITEEVFNEGKHAEAAAAYEKLLPWTSGEVKQNTRLRLAEAHVAMADDFSKPISESLEHLKRANELAPEALGEMHKKLLQSGGRARPVELESETAPPTPPPPAAAQPPGAMLAPTVPPASAPVR